MKKIFFGLLLFTFCQAFSQEVRDEKKITTEDGVITVKINEDGLDYITFSKEQVAELRLVDDIEDLGDALDSDGPGSGSVGISWTIGTRKSKCKSGIGFRCGKKFQASLVYSTNLKTNGRNENGVYDVILQKEKDGGITLIFLNTVDWTWLNER